MCRLDSGIDAFITLELGAMRKAQEEGEADKKTPKSGGGWIRLQNFCTSLGFPLSPNFPHLNCTGSWKMGSPRLHYPTRCIRSLLLRCRGSNYYCLNCTTHLCQRNCDLVVACVSIDSYSQGASLFNIACCGAGKLTEGQLNAARASYLWASAIAMRVTVHQADSLLFIDQIIGFDWSDYWFWWTEMLILIDQLLLQMYTVYLFLSSQEKCSKTYKQKLKNDIYTSFSNLLLQLESGRDIGVSICWLSKCN